MSIKIDQTVNFIPGEKIIRIRRVDRQNKPTSLGIIEYSIYSSEDAKQGDCPIYTTSKDCPAEALVGDDVLKKAYTWMKSELFPGAVDC